MSTSSDSHDDTTLPAPLRSRLDQLRSYRINGWLDEATWDVADALFVAQQTNDGLLPDGSVATANSYAAQLDEVYAQVGGTRYHPLVWTSDDRWPTLRRIASNVRHSVAGQVVVNIIALTRVRRYGVHPTLVMSLVITHLRSRSSRWRQVRR